MPIRPSAAITDRFKNFCPTPNIDRIAKEGMRLTDAWT